MKLQVSLIPDFLLHLFLIQINLNLLINRLKKREKNNLSGEIWERCVSLAMKLQVSLIPDSLPFLSSREEKSCF